MEHDWARFPCAYQAPVRFGRAPPPVLHRAQNVPFDQLILLPSWLSVPVTNCHPGATMAFCPWYCPGEVLPLSLVNVGNAPLSAMEACFVGSPWAHQAPVKAAACGLGGNWAAASFTLKIRLIANTAAKLLPCFTGFLSCNESSAWTTKGYMRNERCGKNRWKHPTAGPPRAWNSLLRKGPEHS